ncbi:hypothetical protein BDB01DRAFT_907644 [Pilobolus umbonatus]|nr:hypothetical protein BDB01DRAFT_907644 [Pilobolus umbonatus]
MNLSDNRLTGTLFPAIGNLINLKKLSVYHNSLTEPIPDEIRSLNTLNMLNLKPNSFNGQFPAVNAPSTMTHCSMLPNQFQSCPDLSVLHNLQSLANRCSVNCITKCSANNFPL